MIISFNWFFIFIFLFNLVFLYLIIVEKYSLEKLHKKLVSSTCISGKEDDFTSSQLPNTNDDNAQNFETSIIFDDKIPVVNFDPVSSTGEYNHSADRNLYFYFIEQFLFNSNFFRD